MAFFYHDPNGNITINDDVESLTIPLSTFLLLEPLYELPDLPPPYVALWQRYDQGVSHVVHSTNHSQFDGAYPWAEGDGYISNLSTYIAEHENPTEDLTIAKNIRHSELLSVYSEKLSGGISLFSTTMPSNTSIVNEVVAYNTAAAVPVGFYLNDSGGSEISLLLSNLNDYQDALMQMKWAMRQQYDVLYNAISAAATIIDVEAVDITSGWPVVPFVPV